MINKQNPMITKTNLKSSDICFNTLNNIFNTFRLDGWNDASKFTQKWCARHEMVRFFLFSHRNIE